MKKPRFLLDVDGPMTESFVAETCRLLRELHDIPAHPEKIDQWDIMRALDVPKHIEDDVYERLRKEGVAFDFVPNDGVQEFVAWLQGLTELHIVTSPLGGPHWAHDRERWLTKHFGIHKKNIASIHSKYIVAGDLFMDDKPEHVQTWSAEHPNGLAILWRIPPNRDFEWPIAASNYEQARHVIERWLAR